MSFKLTHSNKNGTFKIKLNRDVSHEEMVELCQLANNLLPCEIKSQSNPSNSSQFIGPQQQSYEQQSLFNSMPDEFLSGRKLGENPVDSINMGSYVEPHDGVRFKMLYFANLNRVPVIKAFRGATGISIVGTKEIIYGNFPCPILTLEAAQTILEEWRKLGFHAKIIPALSDAA